MNRSAWLKVDTAEEYDSLVNVINSRKAFVIFLDNIFYVGDLVTLEVYYLLSVSDYSVIVIEVDECFIKFQRYE